MATTNPTPRAGEVLTDEDVAAELQIPVPRVQELFRRHEMPGFKVGRRWRMRRADFDRWLRRKSA